MPKVSKKNFYKKMALTLIVGFFVTGLFYLLGSGISLMKTSVVNIPEHKPFNGTTYPVKKVPNWSKMSSEKMKGTYTSFSDTDFIDMPEYDPNKLQTPSESLRWGNAADNIIRNMKITYAVPYMGNYLFDGKENTGSHLAVDIKIPEGTPVYAIANGTVTKASRQSSGFGNHAVLVHNNFPSLEDSGAKIKIYSSYSHLSDLLVNVGDVVNKGQQIGISGMTGTATTPHLHFQIDNDQVDWHPFWPFTNQEAYDAGLNFYSAVSAGLGKDKALAATINPMKYVQKYLNVSTAGSYVDDSTQTNTQNNDQQTQNNDTSSENNNSSNNTDSTSTTQPSTPPQDTNTSVLQFKFEVNPKYYIGGNSEFAVLLRDNAGEIWKGGFTGDISVISTKGNVIAKKSILNIMNFGPDGRISNSFGTMRAGKDKLKIEYDGQIFYSDEFEILDNNQSGGFKDLSVNDKYYQAILYLASKNVVAGYPDGTFKPDKTVSRVEALKLIFEGINEKLMEGPLPFKDVSENEWYSSYLYTARKKGIIDGYPDGTFKPTDSVNKAEFFKMLLNAMKVDVNMKVAQSPYSDVNTYDWFAPFIAQAKDMGIIDSSLKSINPSQGMTRGEVADAIYKLMTLNQ